MKKFLAIILCIGMIVSFMGCAATKDETAVSEEASVASTASTEVSETGEQPSSEPLILQRPEDAVEALAWAKEQTWDKTYTVGFANILESLEIMVELRDYLIECCEAYGMEVIAVDNNLDGATAVSNAEYLISQGIDALIEFNVDESVGGVIMEKCNAANIPVIAIDIPHEGATFFGANNKLCGQLAGEALGEYAKDNWNGEIDALVLIDQMESGELVRNRVLEAITGLREVYPDFSDDDVYILQGGSDAIVSQQTMADFLSAHPDWDHILVCALSGLLGLGTQAAVDTADRVQDVCMIVNNEDYFFEDVSSFPDQSQSCFYGAVTFQLTKYGQWVAPAMREILDTGVMPENVFIDHNIVTRENIDELFPGWRDIYITN